MQSKKAITQDVISVRNNAPNWPAMVSSRSVTTLKQTKQPGYSNLKISCATASLWLETKYQSGMRNSKSTSSLGKRQKGLEKSKFAVKIVRQCTYCQILYTNFHMCAQQTEAKGGCLYENDISDT